MAQKFSSCSKQAPVLFRLGNAATFCKEFIRLAAVDKCFKTGIPALRRGMKDEIGRASCRERVFPLV